LDQLTIEKPSFNPDAPSILGFTLTFVIIFVQKLLSVDWLLLIILVHDVVVGQVAGDGEVGANGMGAVLEHVGDCFQKCFDPCVQFFALSV
jgi:hypothetical protein